MADTEKERKDLKMRILDNFVKVKKDYDKIHRDRLRLQVEEKLLSEDLETLKDLYINT